MDTRYWGPSGWKLFHLITFAYNPKTDKKNMRSFFEILPYVLPCKFCRSSLSQYYEELPIEKALKSKTKLSEWLWKIHGKVNDKLREQGQTIPTDPSFSSVSLKYNTLLDKGYNDDELKDYQGWEFLFSIVENNPLCLENKKEHSSPIPNAPPESELKTEKEYIKWNYLSPEKRFPYICNFWSILPSVLPFSEWRSIWTKNSKNFCSSSYKKENLKQLWKARCDIEHELFNNNDTKCSFKRICKDLNNHRSNCGRKTCRKTRNKIINKTIKNKK